MSKFPGIIQPGTNPEEDLLANSNTANDALAAAASGGDVVGVVRSPSGAVSTIKRALKAVPTATTDSSIVAAVAGKKLRILAIKAVNGATATTITFNSKGSGAGTAISAPFVVAVSAAIDFHPSEFGWFETNAGEAFTATTAASGATVAIQVIYIEV
jgi:hypothetical protein